MGMDRGKGRYFYFLKDRQDLDRWRREHFKSWGLRNAQVQRVTESAGNIDQVIGLS